MTESVGKPPISASAEKRITDDVPQQNAAPQASFDGITMSKKKRCSSGQTSAARRFGLNRIGIDEVLRRLHDADGPVVKQRHGAASGNPASATKSASRIEMNSGCSGSRATCRSAWLMLPALACLLSGRVR